MPDCKQSLIASALVYAALSTASAQVRTVTIRTTGISCGICAAVSEVNFRRMAGVEDVKISLSSESITLSYNAGTKFDPKEVRQVLSPLDVGVVLFRVSAQGFVQQRGEKWFLAAGKNEFMIAPAALPSDIDRDDPILIEGIINYRKDPMELKIVSWKPLKR